MSSERLLESIGKSPKTLLKPGCEEIKETDEEHLCISDIYSSRQSERKSNIPLASEKKPTPRPIEERSNRKEKPETIEKTHSHVENFLASELCKEKTETPDPANFAPKLKKKLELEIEVVEISSQKGPSPSVATSQIASNYSAKLFSNNPPKRTKPPNSTGRSPHSQISSQIIQSPNLNVSGCKSQSSLTSLSHVNRKLFSTQNLHGERPSKHQVKSPSWDDGAKSRLFMNKVELGGGKRAGSPDKENRDNKALKGALGIFLKAKDKNLAN